MITIPEVVVRKGSALDVLEGEKRKDLTYLDMHRSFPYRPTLFLGLGGTGCQAVAALKKLFEKTFEYVQKAEGQTDVIPPMYAFRGFDTARDENPGLAVNQEWFFMGVDNLADVVQHVREEPFYASWLAKSADSFTLTAGACGRRNLGRLAIVYNMDRFAKEINKVFQQITRLDPRNINTKPIVYVFCSLSGGTGSGMLLDACFHIRAEHPEAEIVGVIALVEGLPSMSQSQIRNAKVGCYSALRELNAFMAGTFRDITPEQTFVYPTNNHRGKYTAPFNYCFLLTSSNADGATSLQTQAQLTAFMSRIAYGLAAYSYKDANNPTFFGILQNRDTELADPKKGVRSCFLVPGLRQVHLPIDETADWIILHTANSFLGYLSSGQPCGGDQNARNFVTRLQMDPDGLRQALLTKPDGSVLQLRKYDTEVHTRLAPERRYTEGKKLLDLGDDMCNSRASQLLEEIQPAQTVFHKKFETELKKTLETMICDERYLYKGTDDFLGDLGMILDEYIQQLNQTKEEVYAPSIQVIGKQWVILKPFLKDVTTRSSMFDQLMDRMRLNQCVEQMTRFLNQAEQALFDYVLNTATILTLASAKKVLEEQRQQLHTLYDTHIEGAREIIRGRESQVAVSLHMQELGHGSTPDSVCSLSALTQEVRYKFLERNKEILSPDALMAHMRSKGWNPLGWLQISSQHGYTVQQLIAQDLLARLDSIVSPYYRDRKMEAFFEDIAALHGKQGINEVMSLLIHGDAPPQAKLGKQKVLLTTSAEPITVLAGINESNEGRLAHLFRAKSVAFAKNYERGRITCFSAWLPVAVCGLDDVHTIYGKEYDAWEAELKNCSKRDREAQISLFHAFPQSWTWPDPRETGELDRALQLFAKALLVSEILGDPNDFDRIRMDEISRNPKEKRYALFRIGKQSFWLWPFFEPHQQTPLKGKPYNLGSNISVAIETFRMHPEYQTEANEWVSWFDEHKYEQMSAQELVARITVAKNAIPSDADDEQWAREWKRIHDVLSRWEI